MGAGYRSKRPGGVRCSVIAGVWMVFDPRPRKRDPGQKTFRARRPPGDHRKEVHVHGTENSARIVTMAACGDHRPFHEKSYPSCRPEPNLNRYWFNSPVLAAFLVAPPAKMVVWRGVPQVECAVMQAISRAAIAGERGKKIPGIFERAMMAWRRSGRLCRFDTLRWSRASEPRRLDVCPLRPR